MTTKKATDKTVKENMQIKEKPQGVDEKGRYTTINGKKVYTKKEYDKEFENMICD